MGETTAAEHAEPAEQLVLSRREGAITRITLNRPRVLNALTRQMALEIRGALAAAHSDGSRAVLLDGAGDRGFCGGGDIKAMLAGVAQAPETSCETSTAPTTRFCARSCPSSASWTASPWAGVSA